jgi:hypothetical protein
MPSKKKQAKKVKKSKPRAPKHELAMSGQHSRLLKQICAITDPFCDHALGSKWPDMNTLRSLPYTVRGFQTITLDASGNGCALFCPVWLGGVATGTVTGTTCGFTGNLGYWPGITGITPGQVRLVSGGLTIANTGAPMTSGGVLVVASVAGGESVNLASIDMGSYLQQEIRSRPFAACINAPAACVFRPGGTISRQFNNTIAPQSVSAANTWDWNSFCVMVQGGVANGAVVRVEFFLHFELTFPKGDAFNLMLTPAAPNNTFLQQAAADITSSIQTVAVDTAKQVGSNVMKKALKTVGKLAISAVAARFGGAGAATSAYAITDAMDVD